MDAFLRRYPANTEAAPDKLRNESEWSLVMYAFRTPLFLFIVLAIVSFVLTGSLRVTPLLLGGLVFAWLANYVGMKKTLSR